MMTFQGSHILSVSQFDRTAISRILQVSALMAPYAARKKRCHVLDGAILNNLFFNEFFTILILADVFILLLSFQYTERYSQLIRNTGFIISTILLRLSFSVSGLTSILLIISGIIFGLLILLIYNAIEKDNKLA